MEKTPLDLGPVPPEWDAFSWHVQCWPAEAIRGQLRYVVFLRLRDEGTELHYVRVEVDLRGRKFKCLTLPNLWTEPKKHGLYRAGPEHMELGEAVAEHFQERYDSDPAYFDGWLRGFIDAERRRWGLPSDSESNEARNLRRLADGWDVVLSYEPGSPSRMLADSVWDDASFEGTAEQLRGLIDGSMQSP